MRVVDLINRQKISGAHRLRAVGDPANASLPATRINPPLFATPGRLAIAGGGITAIFHDEESAGFLQP